MKLIYNRYQVSYFGNHPEYLRSGLVFYDLTYSFQAQRIKRSFLNCGTFDSAFYLFDLNGFHIVSSVLYPLNTFSSDTTRL